MSETTSSQGNYGINRRKSLATFNSCQNLLSNIKNNSKMEKLIKIEIHIQKCR